MLPVTGAVSDSVAAMHAAPLPRMVALVRWGPCWDRFGVAVIAVNPVASVVLRFVAFWAADAPVAMLGPRRREEGDAMGSAVTSCA